MTTDRYSRPIGRLSQCAANGVRFPLVTITFLGEQEDITDPEAAVLVAGQTTERQCSVRRQPVDDLWLTPTRSPAGPSRQRPTPSGYFYSGRL